MIKITQQTEQTKQTMNQNMKNRRNVWAERSECRAYRIALIYFYFLFSHNKMTLIQQNRLRQLDFSFAKRKNERETMKNDEKSHEKKTMLRIVNDMNISINA